MLACLMVECMAASSRWLEVVEGGRGGTEWEKEVSNHTDMNYRDGREQKQDGWTAEMEMLGKEFKH